MAKRINFSNPTVENIFTTHNYGDFAQLMFDTGMNQPKVSKEEANDKIREVMYQVLDVDPNCDRKTLRKAIRRHKTDVFEIIEETIEDLLISGWGENPFFNQFVEIKNMNDGDTNEFYVKDDMILTVSELSGNHHDIIRQRLNEGQTFRVKTSWYGIKIYTEYELFMAGKVDWAMFVQKIYEAFDKKMNDMVYEAVMDAGNKVMPTNQFTKTGALDDTTKASLIELVEDVQTANGVEAVIMGTKTALSKLLALHDADWISDEMKQERHTTGKLGIWEGIALVEIPQAFAPNDTTTKLVNNNKLLIMPLADNRFIKVYYEGDAQIKEVSDSDTNMDMTMEYEYQVKMGIATIINRKFGMWTIA